MNMKVNLEVSIDNLLYLDYMKKQQQIKNTKSNEDQEGFWYKQAPPKGEEQE